MELFLFVQISTGVLACLVHKARPYQLALSRGTEADVTYRDSLVRRQFGSDGEEDHSLIGPTQ
jgi:hypothetical protein